MPNFYREITKDDWIKLVRSFRQTIHSKKPLMLIIYGVEND